MGMVGSRWRVYWLSTAIFFGFSVYLKHFTTKCWRKMWRWWDDGLKSYKSLWLLFSPLVSYMQLTSGQVQADAPTEHIHQSCYPESSQLDADLLGRIKLYPFSLSVCGSILSTEWIFKYYSFTKVDWKVGFHSVFLIMLTNHRVSGNEVNQSLQPHGCLIPSSATWVLLVFSSFLLYQCYSGTGGPPGLGTQSWKTWSLLFRSLWGNGRWLQCDVHVCWGRSVGLAKWEPCPGPCPPRGCLPSRDHLQAGPDSNVRKAGEPMPKVTPHQRGAWTEGSLSSCSMGQLHISGVFPAGLSPRCLTEPWRTLSSILPSSWEVLSWSCLQMN